jgi:hypothetical protein
MEAEICDLDELTGSALGDQPPILVFSLFSFAKFLFLSLSLSLSLGLRLGHEALF